MRRTLTWVTVALLLACRAERPRVTARDASAGVVLPPPTAPDGLLGRVLLARPRATAEGLGERVGMRVPIDLLLAVGAGVPMAVLGAVDTARPVTACAVEAAGAGVGWALSLTPRSASEARAALSSRYRMVAVAGLGDRVEAREAGSRAEGVACALVPVADAVTARVVCATDAALLARAGRWLAWTTTAAGGASGAAGDDDVVATMGDGAGPRLRARWAAATTELLTDWTAAASAARREHDRPPDYGDPEAALVVLERARDAVGAAIGEVRALRVGLRLQDEGVALTTAATLPRAGTSGLAEDAVARAGAGGGGAGALARWVAPDADIRGWVNTPGDGHRALWRSAVDAAVRVLGARVGDGAAARRTLEALGGESGAAAALGGVTRGTAAAPGGEWTLVVQQRDGGRSARAALGQLATAPWVRTLRWGGRAVRLTGCGAGAWCATLTGGGEGGAGGAGGGAGGGAATMVLAVRAEALVAIVGARARSALDGIDARARAGGAMAGGAMAGAVPAGEGAESVVVTMRGEGAATAGAPARGGYETALAEGEAVTARGRVMVPWWVVETARGAVARGLP